MTLSATEPRAAQPQASRVAIEEIIVQARQREETLLEAPVAVTALGGETIERLSLTDLSQMSNYVPNLLISYGSSGGASEMFLRGIGTGSGSAGFSSAVGLLIDGVYFERGRWVQQGYFDVEQVEVLKGPQALYFGKNNAACHAGQSIEAGCDSDFDPLTGRFQTSDLSGARMNLAPRWVALAGVLYEQPLGGTGFLLSAGLDGRYSSSYTTARDRVPGTEQNSFVTFDGTLGLLSPDERWEVALIGRNLTNRRIAVRGQGRALTGGPSGLPEGDPGLGPLADSVVRIERGRQLWLQGTFRF